MTRQLLKALVILPLTLYLWEKGSASQPAKGIEKIRMSLPYAIEIALENNPIHLNNLDYAEMAKIDLESARSIYKTKFRSSSATDARSGADVGSAYSLYLNKQSPSGSNYSAGFYNYNFGDRNLSEFRISYTLPWFRDPLKDGSFSIEQKEISLARRNLLNLISQQELINQVVADFFQFALARKSVEVSKLKLDIAQRLVTTANIRAGNNLIDNVELAKIQLQYKRTKQQNQSAIFDQRESESAFKATLGLPSNEPIALENTNLSTVEIPFLDKSPKELEKLAMENRIEVIGKEKELDVLRKKLALSTKRSASGIDLSLQYSLVGESNNFNDSLSLNEQRFGIGLNMDTDFGSGDKNRHNRQLYLQYQMEARNAKLLNDRIRREVNEALNNASRNEMSLEISQDSLSIAEQEFSRAKIRFEGNAGDELAVLQAQLALEEARFTLFSTRVNYLLAGQKLVMAVGKIQ